MPACKAPDANGEGEPIRPELSALPPELREAEERRAATPPAKAGQAVQPAPANRGAETWNASQIDWKPFDEGVAIAKRERKPVCLVLYTSWCPHCRNYSHVFDDPRVVAKSKRFVMVRADADQESALAGRFATDGIYVPRTYFLSPDGVADPEIHAPRPKYQYFYDERDPSSILGGMDSALAKLAR